MQTPRNKTNDHLANERTFLAWIRTSIAVMGFGFLVVKFSLFIKQIALLMGEELTVPARGYSGAMGIALVAVGACTTLFAFVSYKQTKTRIEKDLYNGSSTFVIAITVFIVLVSGALIWYLLENIS